MLRPHGNRDARVVRRVLAGNSEEFEILVERYLPVVRATAVARLRNTTDADDVVQETFLKAYQKLDTLRETQKFGAWLLTITRNVCSRIGLHRTRSSELAETGPGKAAVVLPDTETADLHTILHEQILNLEEGKREILLMHYFAGKSLREMADLLQISRAAVAKRLQRAREALGERMLRRLDSVPSDYRSSREKTSKVMGIVLAAPAPWKVGAPASTVALPTSHAFAGWLLANKAFILVAFLVFAGLAGAWVLSQGDPSEAGAGRESVARASDEAPLPNPPMGTSKGRDATAESKATEEDAATTEEAAVPGCSVTGRVHHAVSGEGIASVVVTAYPRAEGLPKVLSEPTDESGAYSIEGLAEGEYTLQRRHTAGYSRPMPNEEKRVRLAPEECLNGVDFPLTPAARLYGKVVDAKGRAVSAIRIGLDTEADGFAESAISEEDGSFAFPAVAFRRRVRLQAAGKEMVSPVKGPIEVRAANVDVGVLQLNVRANHRIFGRVVSASGEGVADLDIWTWRQDRALLQNRDGKTASDGTFQIDGLIPGPYRMLFPPVGTWEDSPLVVVPKEGDATGVVLARDAGGNLSISGRVTDTNGNPIQGSDVACFGPPVDQYVLTDNDGTFNVAGLEPGAYEIRAYFRSKTTKRLAGIQAGSKGIEIVLSPRPLLEGKVIEENTGQPVQAFKVCCLPGILDRPPRQLASDLKATRNREGRFRVDAEEEGEATLFVRAPGFLPAIHVVKGLRAGATTGGTLVRLKPACVVQGLVVDASKQPVSDALVFVGPISQMQPIEKYAAARTTADGHFTLDTLEPGRTLLSACHDEHAPAHLLITVDRTSAEPVELVMPAGGVVEGKINVSGVTSIEAWAEGSGRRKKTEVADSDGRYRLEHVALGDVRVGVSMMLEGDEPIRRHVVRRVVVEEGQTTAVDFDIPPALSAVEGLVTLNGGPMADASIRCTVDTPSGEEDVFERTQADGPTALSLSPREARFSALFTETGKLTVQRNCTGRSANKNS